MSTIDMRRKSRGAGTSTKDIADIGTSFLTRSADILFVSNPKGTSIGAFAGIASEGVSRAGSPDDR